MIDFTNCEVNKYKCYGGKNGGKYVLYIITKIIC